MRIDKSKVAIGFMVIGALTVVFGVVLLFVGPTVMKEKIIEVRQQFSVMKISFNAGNSAFSL